MKHYSKKILPLAIALASAPALSLQDDQNEEASRYDGLLEELVVEGVRSAELNARLAERDKDNFSSIVTQDDAGNFSDQNVAELLQRLPGITLHKTEGEGRFISLRGLGPNFVSVQMDGAEMASGGGGFGDEGSSGDDRGFSLDSLPADVLQSIEVNKSLTPDMELNAIGGSVNVRSLSALDRGKDSFRVSAQGYYQEEAAETSPKLTLQGTNLFLDDTLGAAYTLSWEKRSTQGYETRHHPNTLPRHVTDTNGARMAIPWEFETRQENAERERIAALVNLEYRPTESSRYHLKLNHTSYKDLDIALREYYRFGQNSSSSITHVDPVNRIFGLEGVDLQQQYFIQDGKTSSNTISIGGENLFGDDWKLNYEYATSRSEMDKPDARRVQFRLRGLAMLGQYDDLSLNGQVIHPLQLAELASTGSITTPAISAPNGYQYGGLSQPNMGYDNLFMESSYRKDTIDQFGADLRRDFHNSELVNYFKTGFKVKSRERERDKDRASVVPFDKALLGCGGDQHCIDMAGARLGEFETYIPENRNFDHAFITRREAERLIAATRTIGDNYDPDRNKVDSTRLDYDLSEDTSALYAMAEFQVLDNATLIAGARYEHTKFDASGFMSIRNDREESSDQLESFDVALPLENTGNSYGHLFPSVHFRQELRDDLLLRASLWTSFTRPDFGQSLAYFTVTDRVIFCNFDPAANLGSDNCSDQPSNLQGDIASADFTGEYKAQNMQMAAHNNVRIGNPKLDPMRATNLDFSLGWYASEDLFLQGAFFYKDIKDFIVDATGVNLALDGLPFTLPVDQVDMFHIPEDLVLTNASTYLNGDNARVYGMELSYSQYFGGMLENFFVQSNLTLQRSSGKVGDTVRAGKVQLPEQADVAANLTLGWENESLSLRLIGNYTSEILKRIGACTRADVEADALAGFPENCQKWADLYQDDALTFDAKASYRYNSNLKFYFDAINITDSVDYMFFRGDNYTGGAMLFNAEHYGPAYQLGVQYNF